MPISFFDLLADEGWEPLDFFQGDPTFYWNDGGFIANAPVDIAATLDGAIWRSTNVERGLPVAGTAHPAGLHRAQAAS